MESGTKLTDIYLTDAQKQEVITLIRRYLPGTRIWAYGSRVTFKAMPYSDLDLVAFTRPEQKKAVYDLREAFDESALPFRVDLFVWDDVPVEFHKKMATEHVVLQEGQDSGMASSISL